MFPVFTDEQVAQYQAEASADELAMLEEWCGVAKTINPQNGKHLVVANLFWKNCGKDEGDLPPITREVLMNARELGLVSRFAPWDHYVRPLLHGAAELKEKHPEVVFRVYLAADLEFLVEDLVAVGCEVMLMKSSSIRHNPGAMWRFLAMEEHGRWVTITDSDRAHMVVHDVERTEEIMSSGLGFWRAPYVFDALRNNDHPGFYRTANACHLGVVGGYPVELLMKAFLWHTVRGTMPNQCLVGVGDKAVRLPIFGTDWPSYGFDEWFLNAVMYPRLAFSGVATFYPTNGTGPVASHWLAMDIEYVTWANPRSEVIYFGETDLFGKLAEDRKSPPAESEILTRMLGEKRSTRKKQVLHFPGRQDRLTVAVARYNENLDWITKLPGDVTVAVYNKGENIVEPKILARIDHLETLPNEGREADTYLHHLENYEHDTEETWTVFTQGDPFPHNPSFLYLLNHRDAWAEVQALTSYYLGNGHTPPRVLTELQDSEWVRGIPVRTEISSARSLGNMSWQDGEAAYRCFRDYAEFYQVPHGWSLTGHFIESCGLISLAEEAWRAVTVRYAYAAIFAVRNDRLSMIPQECIPKMRKLACEHYSVGYMYERLWLHLFGQPFVTEAAVSRIETEMRASEPVLA